MKFRPVRMRLVYLLDRKEQADRMLNFVLMRSAFLPRCSSRYFST